MSIPNPLQLRISGRRDVQIDEEPLQQVGTDVDFMNLYPEVNPVDRIDAHEILTDDNTIFIDNNLGLDTNPGTETSPVKTVDKAVQLATADDDIYYLCFKGTTYIYVEDVYVPVKYSFYNDTAIASKYRYILRSAPAGINDTNSYFVNFKNGNDGLAGTQSAPVKTLQKCFDLSYAAGAVDKNIIILVDDTFTEDDYTTEESCELIFPSANNRKIYVLWRRGVDDFTTGTSAKLKFAYEERATSSSSVSWRDLFYEQGLFQQGGLETAYSCAISGGNAYIKYSTDGINWIASGSIVGVSCYGFGYVNYSGTDYMLLATSNGIYYSTTGLTWTITAYASTGNYQQIFTWNNNTIISGSSGISRSPDAFTASNVAIDTGVSVGYANPASIGSYLYYANNTIGNVIKKCDTSWATSDHVTITELTKIYDLIEFNGYLYCLGVNSSTLTYYFIKINSISSDYEIIYSQTYTGSNYPFTMSVIDERIYLPNFISMDKLYAFDGDIFYEIGTLGTSNQISYTDFRFKNRFYYTSFTVDTIKYGLLDCLTINGAGSNSDLYINGLLFSGNNKKALDGIRSENIINSQLDGHIIKWCNFFNFFNYAIYLPFCTYPSGIDTVLNNIFLNSKNGIKILYYCRSCYFHNILNRAIENVSTGTLFIAYNSILDMVNEVGGGLNRCIVSRCNSILINSSDNVTIEGSLIQLPCNMNNTYIYDYIGVGYFSKTKFGTPIFRNRDAVNQDFPDYRLQKRWIKANNGEYYKFDSPGVDFYETGSVWYDAGCYTFTRTLHSDTYKYIWNADFNPHLIPIASVFNNLNQLLTVAGIKQSSHTGDQNKLSIPFIPDSVDEWRTIRDLYTMVRSNEQLRIDLNHWLDYTEVNRQSYVKTNDVGLFSGPSVIGSGNWLAKFYFDDMKLVQKEHTWYENEFKGYLIYLSWDDSGTRKTVWLKIIKNTEDTLYLYDVDGLYELPSTDIDNSNDSMYYIIGSMYVKCNTKQLESQLAMWYRKTNPGIGSLDIELLETP